MTCAGKENEDGSGNENGKEKEKEKAKAKAKVYLRGQCMGGRAIVGSLCRSGIRESGITPVGGDEWSDRSSGQTAAASPRPTIERPAVSVTICVSCRCRVSPLSPS